MGGVQHVPKPGVVEMGHIHYNACLLQSQDRLSPQGSEAMVGLMAGAQGVLPVPCKGKHFYSVPAKLLHVLQSRPQQGAIFHCQHQGGFLLLPGGGYFLRCGAGQGLTRAVFHLPLETVPVEAVIAQCLLGSEAVRHKDSAALAPRDGLDFGQSKGGAGVV